MKPCCGPSVPWLTIVGVLKDVKQGGVDKKTGTELYFDFEQLPASLPAMTPGTMNIVMRLSLPADALAGPIGGEVAALDPSLPVVSSIDGGGLRRGDWASWLLAELLGIFAGLAVTLAAIGSYGVLVVHGVRAGARLAFGWRSAPDAAR